MSKDPTVTIDGPKVAAAIITRLPRTAQARLVESIRVINPTSAIKIEAVIHSQAHRSPKLSAASRLERPQEESPITAGDLTRSTPALKAPKTTRAKPESLSEPPVKSGDNPLGLESHEIESLEAAQAKIIRELDQLYSETSGDDKNSQLGSRRLRGRVA
jgi:hypothetical protein